MIYTNNGLIQLDQCIETIRADLEKNALRPDASEFYNKNQNHLLKNLGDCLNYFEQVKYLENWSYIEKVMRNHIQNARHLKRNKSPKHIKEIFLSKEFQKIRKNIRKK